MRFNNGSEVVRPALRLLDDQEQTHALKLQELRVAIQAGAASRLASIQNGLPEVNVYPSIEN